MQRIGIDCRFASSLGGLGTYTRETVLRLLQLRTDIRWILFCKESDPSWLPKNLQSNIEIVSAPFHQYSIAEQWHFPGLIARANLSVLWVPHFNVPLFCSTPFILTIHDLILHRYPNGANICKQSLYKILLGFTLRRAKHILTVSHATESELLAVFPSTKKKISVVYPGVSQIFRPASNEQIANVRQKYVLSKSFLLYIGNTKEHKNVPILLEAYRKANLQNVDLVLITDRVHQLQLPKGCRALSNVSEQDLPAIYAASSGFVTATLAEGFGLPVLEAMACGCPVLATTIECFQEISYGHAVLVSPTVDALASGMHELISKGRSSTSSSQVYAQSFSWETTAKNVYSVLTKGLLP